MFFDPPCNKLPRSSHSKPRRDWTPACHISPQRARSHQGIPAKHEQPWDTSTMSTFSPYMLIHAYPSWSTIHSPRSTKKLLSTNSFPPQILRSSAFPLFPPSAEAVAAVFEHVRRTCNSAGWQTYGRPQGGSLVKNINDDLFGCFNPSHVISSGSSLNLKWGIPRKHLFWSPLLIIVILLPLPLKTFLVLRYLFAFVVILRAVVN